MSCNGCRVLRKGCSESCILRPCLEWIESAEAQGYATLFDAKFFGRADLMSFISAVPNHQRPALFQSLLFEACGRTINPVHGAIGLVSSGNWYICQAAVSTVLRGGTLRPIPPELLTRAGTLTTRATTSHSFPDILRGKETTPQTSATTNIGENDENALAVRVQQKRKLLNLFV